MTQSPVVRLNRAVALAEADGAAAGLALLSSLDDALPNNHRLHAVRADLARRTGDRILAKSAYSQALALCTNTTEANYLTSRLADLT